MTTVRWGGCRVRVTGHAGYSRGPDVVCAALSVLCYTLARSVAELEAAGKVRGCVCRLEKGDAEIACEPVEAGDPAVRAVFETVGRGFRLLSEGYGAHVRCIADGEEVR